MVGLIQQMLGPRPYVPIAHLPTEGFARATGIGHMGLVWPWFQVADPQPLVDSFGRDTGVIPALEVRAPRSDRDVALIVWSESAGGPSSAGDWATSVARMYREAVVVVNTPLRLNGAAGRLLRLDTSTESTWRVLVPRSATAVNMEVGVPRSHADAYWAQVESMLATWNWDR